MPRQRSRSPVREPGAGPGKGGERRATRRFSRRRFMALLATGALAAAAPARAVTIRKAATAPRRTATRTPAIEKGIAEQKAALAKQLKTLRDYRLEPGTDMAFVFRPLPPRRMR